jgi:xanthine dehydrogenase accessory factor
MPDPAIDVLARITALGREGQSFAVATVVGRRPPVSAHLGDRAIVFADGRMEGFVGGACSREIVRQQALEALAARQSRLVSIRPDAEGDRESSAEHAVVSMSCASEGAVDVFVEPFVQARSLLVVGATPVADALARLGRAMGCDVTRVVDAREQRDVEAASASLGVQVVLLDTIDTALERMSPDGAVVVASQGHYDEQALEAILKRAVPYVGLVASRRRGAAVRALVEEGVAGGFDAVRNPAGLDLGARTAPEVALSILAEIVRAHPRQVQVPAAATSERPQAATEGPPAAPAVDSGHSGAPAAAVDPVCGMRVDVATARHTAEVGGVTYYFCCAGCRSRFLKAPQEYGVPA